MKLQSLNQRLQRAGPTTRTATTELRQSDTPSVAKVVKNAASDFGMMVEDEAPVDAPQPRAHEHSSSARAPYDEFMRIRVRLLSTIRRPIPAMDHWLEEITSALVELEKRPTGLVSWALLILTRVCTIHSRRRSKARLGKVVCSLLEQIFDPGLRFKMTKRDILDSFQAYGMNHDEVTAKQIEEIYVRILSCLKHGGLRDLTYLEPALHRYVGFKLLELEKSRKHWSMNER